MTDKFTNVTLNVKAQKIPTAVVGLKPDVSKGVVAKNALTFKANDFRYQDQFGNFMTAAEVKEAGTFKLAVSYTVSDGTKPAFATLTGGAPALGVDNKTQKLSTTIAAEDTVVVPLTAGGDVNDFTGDITVQLTSNDDKNIGEAKKFTVYAVPLKQMNGFEIKELGLRPSYDVAGKAYLDGLDHAVVDNAAQRGITPTVYGLYAGEKITLKVTDDFTVDSGDGVHFVAPTLAAETAKNEVVTKKAKVSVTIADGNGTKVEKEYSYSNAKRVVKSVELAGNVVDLGNIGDATAKQWSDFEKSFKVKDQYDDLVQLENNALPFLTFDFTKVTDPKFKLDNAKLNGTNKVKLLTTGAGVAVNATTDVPLKITFPGSSAVFDKVVTLKKTN